MHYAQKHLTNYNFFMAEKFFDLFQNKQRKDYLSLEDELTKYSDCIIVVLESESAYSELGAFAMKDELAQIMLVVNDKAFSESKSFISLGPVAKVNRISKFGPTIYTDLKSILSIAPEISKRLSKIKKGKLIKIDIRSYEQFSQISPKIRMAFILDLLSLLHPLSHQELISVLKEIYGPDKSYDINVELALLMALDLIKQIDDYYVRTAGDYGRFLRFYTINEISLRAQIINHYHKYARFKASILRKKLEKAK